MKVSELKRWLKQQGCTFIDRKRHTEVILGKRKTILPRHPAQELKTGTLKAILKDLDLTL